MNKRKEQMAEKAKALIANKVTKNVAAKLHIYNTNPKVLNNKSDFFKERWETRRKAAVSASKLAQMKCYLNELSDEERDQFYAKRNAEIDAFYANEKAKADAKAKLFAKPVKKLLLGKPTGIGILESYDFKYYTVTIMNNCVYINRPLFKSQVAELTPLLTDDGEFNIDMKYYTFMSVKDAHHSKQLKDNATLYVNWTNVKAPIDAYGDLQLYNAGLYSYEDLLLKYAKGVDINYVSNPYNMNKQIKSIISVSKILSDSYTNYNVPIWEDPKIRYNAFAVDVYINKYQFTMINNSLRNNQFINYRLIDGLPIISKITSVLKSGKIYVNDNKPLGITVKKIDDKFKFYINNILFSAYNKNQSIECNKNGNIIPLPKPKPDLGYSILKRYYLSNDTYTKSEEQIIFKYMAEELENPELVIKGSTEKVLEYIESIYYYCLRNTDIDYVVMTINHETTYSNNAFHGLINELCRKWFNHESDTTIDDHIDNAFADLGYVIETLELEENIHLETLNEDKKIYKLQIK